MGTSLNGLTPAGTYPGLIKTGDNAPIDGTLKTLSDGNGNNLPMAVSTTAVNFTNQLQQSGVAVPTASQVAAKQDTLVSGTNIKTINGTSVLGSGNIAVVTSPSGVSGAIQFSNGSAFASDAANLFWDDTNNRLGVGTNAPSSPLDIINDSISNAMFSVGPSFAKGFQIINTNSTANPVYVVGINSTYINTRIGFFNSLTFRANGTEIAEMTSSEVRVGGATGARVGIKGSGSTSATTSLLVQNSAGVQSLRVNDDGSVFNYGKGAISSNTAFGEGAVANNTSGTQITAFGTNSLSANSTGVRNTAFGNAALTSTSTGSSNNAFGFRSLVLNTGGGNNTAMGDLSLERTTVSNNTAFGSASLQNTSTGSGNVGVGANALNANTTGSNNSALGFNTASGNFSGSVILGNEATATASNQFVVGSSTTNAGAVNSTSDVPATFLWSVRINGTNYKILMTT